MDEFTDIPVIALGVYEHYKGKHYRVLGTGRHTETDDYFVVYAPLYGHAGQPGIWLRPYSMFVEEVEVDSKVVPRFRKISEE